MTLQNSDVECVMQSKSWFFMNNDNFSEEEDVDFCKLISHLKSKNFKNTQELNDYIITGNLKKYFPEAPFGVGTFGKRNVNTWDRNGVIETNLYFLICSRLGLSINPTSKLLKFSLYQNDNSYDSNNEFDDLVKLYGGDPTEMTDEEKYLFVETQEPDFD